jgi:WD40 repeat protein
LESFGNHDNTITHCVISECGDLIVTSSEDCTCNVWEVHPKKLLLTFKGHDYGVQCCDLSPDNDLVVSGDIESCVKVWSVSTGIVRSSWIHSDGGVTWSAFTPNGSSVVISDQASVLKLYDLKGVTLSVFPIISYSPHSPGNIYDLSWSRGPSRTSSTGSNTFSFTIRQCVCSRDGSLLAAAVADCTAKVWSMTTQNCLHSFRHATEVLCVDFSPNAKLLATGSASGMVKVYVIHY